MFRLLEEFPRPAYGSKAAGCLALGGIRAYRRDIRERGFSGRSKPSRKIGRRISRANSRFGRACVAGGRNQSIALEGRTGAAFSIQRELGSGQGPREAQGARRRPFRPLWARARHAVRRPQLLGRRAIAGSGSRFPSVSSRGTPRESTLGRRTAPWASLKSAGWGRSSCIIRGRNSGSRGGPGGLVANWVAARGNRLGVEGCRIPKGEEAIVSKGLIFGF